MTLARGMETGCGNGSLVTQWTHIGVPAEGRQVVKNLVKHGNSYALVIDRPILDLIRVEPDTPLEITTDGEGLFIRPVRAGERREKVRKATKRLLDVHERSLRNLAK